MTNKVFQLLPKVQNYAWGKVGKSSKVAELISNAYPEIEIDLEQKYAEVNIHLSSYFHSVIIALIITIIYKHSTQKYFLKITIKLKIYYEFFKFKLIIIIITTFFF